MKLAAAAFGIAALLYAPYLWAKTIQSQRERKERRELAKAEKAAIEQKFSRENSAFIHAERKRLYPEILLWVEQLTKEGICFYWQWKLGESRQIEIRFLDSDEELPCKLDFVEIGSFVHLASAEYQTVDGRTVRLNGRELTKVPKEMYVQYFHAVILQNISAFSTILEKARKKKISFPYCELTRQSKAGTTREMFEAFCEALGEEVLPLGFAVNGDFSSLKVTVKTVK